MRPAFRRTLRTSAVTWSALALLAALESWGSLGICVHRADFGGAIGAIIGGVASFFGFGGSGGNNELIRFQLGALREGMVRLANSVREALWDLAKLLGAVPGLLRAFWSRVVKPALVWLNNRLLALERFLKDKFAPVLRWLANLRRHLDDFYRRFIRPITDTIDFIRAVNRVLNGFHIRVLNTLDEVLTKIEDRIDAPFEWVRSKIVELQNAVNRIVTADGFFQRLTLLRSLSKYAPEWMHEFWSRQVRGMSPEDAAAAAARKYRRENPVDYGVELGRSYRGVASAYDGVIAELVPLWRQSAGFEPSIDEPD